jgi:hypothetical protein
VQQYNECNTSATRAQRVQHECNSTTIALLLTRSGHKQTHRITVKHIECSKLGQTLWARNRRTPWNTCSQLWLISFGPVAFILFVFCCPIVFSNNRLILFFVKYPKRSAPSIIFYMHQSCNDHTSAPAKGKPQNYFHTHRNRICFCHAPDDAPTPQH